jgi:translation initiation factor 1
MEKMKFTSFADLNQLIPEAESSSSANQKKAPSHNGKGKQVQVLLDTKGRKGKSVTVVAGLKHNPATMEEIARILKQHCSAGGTVKEGNIEIQGDQRTKVKEKLKSIGYVPTN